MNGFCLELEFDNVGGRVAGAGGGNTLKNQAAVRIGQVAVLVVIEMFRSTAPGIKALRRIAQVAVEAANGIF